MDAYLQTILSFQENYSRSECPMKVPKTITKYSSNEVRQLFLFTDYILISCNSFIKKDMIYWISYLIPKYSSLRTPLCCNWDVFNSLFSMAWLFLRCTFKYLWTASNLSSSSQGGVSAVLIYLRFYILNLFSK